MSPLFKKKKPKKMSHGGYVKDEHNQNPVGPNEQKARDQIANAFGPKPVKKAHGGMIKDKNEMKSHPKSIAEAIMRKRKAKQMADGGEVDLDLNKMEVQPNDFDDQNLEAALKELYDDGLDEFPQPEDSNQIGDDEEKESENKLDMISAIRRRMKSKKM